MESGEHAHTSARANSHSSTAPRSQATVDLPAELVMHDSSVIDRVIEVFFEQRQVGPLAIYVRAEPPAARPALRALERCAA